MEVLIAIGIVSLFLGMGWLFSGGDFRDPWGVVADMVACREEGHIPNKKGNRCKRCRDAI